MDPILGMIILWAGERIPGDWFLCDGRLLQIREYTALYSLIGTKYGGDGKITFGLPDLRSRVPIGAGQGPGLIAYPLGITGGVETVTLTVAQLPPHNHPATGTLSATGTLPVLSASGSLPASSHPGTSTTPGPALFPAQAPDYTSQGLSDDFIYGPSDNVTKLPVSVSIPGGQNIALSGSVTVSVANTGTGQIQENRQPYIALQYIIACQGIYPSQG